MNSHSCVTDDPEFPCYTATACQSHDSVHRTLLLIWGVFGWLLLTHLASADHHPGAGWSQKASAFHMCFPHLPSREPACSYGGSRGPREEVRHASGSSGLCSHQIFYPPISQSKQRGQAQVQFWRELRKGMGAGGMTTRSPQSSLGLPQHVSVLVKCHCVSLAFKSDNYINNFPGVMHLLWKITELDL